MEEEEEEEEGGGRIKPEKQASREILELREIQTCMSAMRRPAALSKQSRQAAMRLATLATQVLNTLAIQVARKAKSQHQVGQGPVREHSFCSQIITQI